MLQALSIILVALAAGAAVAIVYGARRWRLVTRELRSRLEAARTPIRPEHVDFRRLEGLPVPVQRYFRAVLKDGQPMVAGARVQHTGMFNTKEGTDEWKPFTSDQRVIVNKPGFDWNARICIIPGLFVRVHDAYVAGEGILQVSLLGLFSLVSLRGANELAEGELMRFFAEAAWYPTALLPGRTMRWEAMDDRSAQGTLTDGAISVTMLFSFNREGLIETVRSQARARMTDGKLVPTPWIGRFWNYTERDGMKVPIDGEVSWLLREGEKPYWRARITEIVYEFAR